MKHVQYCHGCGSVCYKEVCPHCGKTVVYMMSKERHELKTAVYKCSCVSGPTCERCKHIVERLLR